MAKRSILAAALALLFLTAPSGAGAQGWPHCRKALDELSRLADRAARQAGDASGLLKRVKSCRGGCDGPRREFNRAARRARDSVRDVASAWLRVERVCGPKGASKEKIMQ